MTGAGPLTPAEVLEEVRRSPTQKVKLAVADVDGILRGKYVHRDKFLSAAESGFGFCNVVFGWDSSDVCYDNASYTGWHTGYPDALARIDLSTFRRVPWEDGVPFFLADFEDGQGQPLAVCPRSLLKRVLARATQRGLVPRSGVEYEWFNFKETPQSLAEKRHVSPQPLTPGMFGYSLLRIGHSRPYFAALFDELAAFGVPLEGLHTETGPGVFEAAILYGDALEAADRGVLFKTAVKEIAQRFGVMPTFMARWSSDLPGCGCHLHQSLWSEGTNLFHDEADPLRMSATFKSYLAGLLRALPEVLPFFAPTVNSYTRLVEGFWAPTRVTWGVDNRTVAFRVIPGGPKSTRVEVRVPGADINPFLAMAASVAAGLWGVEQKLELKQPPVTGSAYESEKAVRLPRTLQEATHRLRDSALARELLGAEFVDHFVRTREWEWKQAQKAVTDWELRRYFEII
ncbi:MAG TPA: glutamine synthetase family protein [Vicinamibacteria bacterium]|nr:glutamine synthetase family protein [Vicinamibacteria bacterium]